MAPRQPQGAAAGAEQRSRQRPTRAATSRSRSHAPRATFLTTSLRSSSGDDGLQGPLADPGSMTRQPTPEADNVIGAILPVVPVLEAAEAQAHHLR